jgi:hypothetical protein
LESNSDSLPTPAPQPIVDVAKRAPQHSSILSKTPTSLVVLPPKATLDPNQFNYALSIVADEDLGAMSGGVTDRSLWHFYPTYYQEAVDCRPLQEALAEELVWKVEGNPYYLRPITVKLLLFEKTCYYMNSGGNEGKLWCKDKSIGIDCRKDETPAQACGPGIGMRKTMFTCEFRNVVGFTKRDGPEITTIVTPSQPTDVVKRAPAETLVTKRDTCTPSPGDICQLVRPRLR